MNYEQAKKFIIKKLDEELPPWLYYHNLSHTLDVLDAAMNIAKEEKVSKPDLLLLKTACLFHDSGMLRSYTGHEEASIEITKEVLPEFDYSQREIDLINQMIITTQLPQDAKHLLEKILCDADLDYLGRDDFFMISHQLRQEWLVSGFKTTNLIEWYQLQVEFLRAHIYFTLSSKNTREAGKMENLNQILALLNHK